MLVARLLAILALIGSAVLCGAYLFTADRRYLAWLRKLLYFVLAFAGVFLALYVAERLLVVI